MHLLIDFFGRNLHFVQQGFYPGFADLLFDTILSDPRSVSEVWLVSVLLKIVSLGVTDPHFLGKVEKLIDANIDRFAHNALMKLIILVLA